VPGSQSQPFGLFFTQLVGTASEKPTFQGGLRCHPVDLDAVLLDAALTTRPKRRVGLDGAGHRTTANSPGASVDDNQRRRRQGHRGAVVARSISPEGDALHVRGDPQWRHDRLA